MKIFNLPSHITKDRTGGVDYVRIISPMKNLDGYKDVESFIYNPKVEELHNNPIEWLDIVKKYDIIYFNYLNNPWGFAAMGSMARAHGVKLVMDMDDDLWDVHEDNPAYKTYHKGSEALNNFTSICNEVDYITCTNDYLKHLIMSKTNKKADQIKVFPNYIDLDVYKHRSPFKDDGQILLTHYGSSSHWLDLEEQDFFEGVDRIMKEYPNVKLRTIGMWTQKFKKAWGSRYEVLYGDQDIYKWIGTPDKFPKFMDETDIMVVPLTVDTYNLCKSDIKWKEASSAKKPGVYQRIRQYQEPIVEGKNGMLAGNPNEWYRAIKKLIDDKELRRTMGENAFKDVEEKYQIKDHLQEYYDFFHKMLIDKKN